MASFKIQSSAQQSVDRIRSDVASELPDSNPYLPNSKINAMITGFGLRTSENNILAQIAIRERFLTTAKLEQSILNWGKPYSLTPNPATNSRGNIVAQGINGTAIPAGTKYQSSTGFEYTTQDLETITSSSTQIESIVSGGGIASVTTDGDHNLATGVTVTISGATQPEYNITAIIVVTGTDTFSYDLESNPPPATGLISAAHTTASITVESDDVGVNTNLTSGEVITLQVPIVGVNDNAFVDFNNVQGGNDQEDIEDYRDRVLFVYQNPPTPLNVPDIEKRAKTVPGVTRVFTKRITPNPGQFTVYFTRDNDTNNIPNPAQVEEVRETLLPLPAYMEDQDLIVKAPTPVTVNISLSNLVPDTPTMRTAIIANINQFYRESTQEGTDVTEDQNRCAILGTIDLETGDSLQSFSLISPLGNVSIDEGELAVFGDVTFS